jgi:hypothetical protein
MNAAEYQGNHFDLFQRINVCPGNPDLAGKIQIRITD